VSLIVVADASKAQYVVRSSVNQRGPSNPAVVVNNTSTAIAGDNNSANSVHREIEQVISAAPSACPHLVLLPWR
jgi:hypothetical protein